MHRAIVQQFRTTEISGAAQRGGNIDFSRRHAVRRGPSSLVPPALTTVRLPAVRTMSSSVDVSNPLRGTPADERRYGRFETFEVRRSLNRIKRFRGMATRVTAVVVLRRTWARERERPVAPRRLQASARRPAPAAEHAYI